MPSYNVATPGSEFMIIDARVRLPADLRSDMAARPLTDLRRASGTREILRRCHTARTRSGCCDTWVKYDEGRFMMG